MNKAVLRGSVRLYGFLLNFYPKRYRQEFGEEMQYVFSESLKDAYTEHGGQGIITLWARTLVDAGKSLVTQHLEDQKGSVSMRTDRTSTTSAVFSIISLIFGITFFVIGVLNAFLVHLVPAVFYLLLSFVYFPPAAAILENRFGFSIPLVVKIILGFIILWATLAVGDLAEILGL